ncbi:hypothetical protein EDEG_02684 [Edhazardia aedis USNM 41457]|uniref:Uncharacterized protein n=1 Tax=Edhazardia aedis (strain USNM 41457) TaxID=1003232 RepID=J9D5U7_EDHAE|nr:hypothetical protein EDEG_02684 [Edhazardia aedis USNM 41457]|eukprot:EJW02919.1 hypothetical protein EDEG_02684 [Edhazardia aedis USNM 41457]
MKKLICIVICILLYIENIVSTHLNVEELHNKLSQVKIEYMNHLGMFQRNVPLRMSFSKVPPSTPAENSESSDCFKRYSVNNIDILNEKYDKCEKIEKDNMCSKTIKH